MLFMRERMSGSAVFLLLVMSYDASHLQLQSEMRCRSSHKAQGPSARADDPHATPAIQQGKQKSNKTHQRGADPDVF